jgi:hypothetical protein
MSDLPFLDVTGRRRPPTATPGFLSGRVPPNKGGSSRLIRSGPNRSFL